MSTISNNLVILSPSKLDKNGKNVSESIKIVFEMHSLKLLHKIPYSIRISCVVGNQTHVIIPTTKGNTSLIKMGGQKLYFTSNVPLNAIFSLVVVDFINTKTGKPYTIGSIQLNYQQSKNRRVFNLRKESKVIGEIGMNISYILPSPTDNIASITNTLRNINDNNKNVNEMNQTRLSTSSILVPETISFSNKENEIPLLVGFPSPTGKKHVRFSTKTPVKLKQNINKISNNNGKYDNCYNNHGDSKINSSNEIGRSSKMEEIAEGFTSPEATILAGKDKDKSYGYGVSPEKFPTPSDHDMLLVEELLMMDEDDISYSDNDNDDDDNNSIHSIDSDKKNSQVSDSSHDSDNDNDSDSNNHSHLDANIDTISIGSETNEFIFNTHSSDSLGDKANVITSTSPTSISTATTSESTNTECANDQDHGLDINHDKVINENNVEEIDEDGQVRTIDVRTGTPIKIQWHSQEGETEEATVAIAIASSPVSPFPLIFDDTNTNEEVIAGSMVVNSIDSIDAIQTDDTTDQKHTYVNKDKNQCQTQIVTHTTTYSSYQNHHDNQFLLKTLMAIVLLVLVTVALIYMLQIEIVIRVDLSKINNNENNNESNHTSTLISNTGSDDIYNVYNNHEYDTEHDFDHNLGYHGIDNLESLSIIDYVKPDMDTILSNHNKEQKDDYGSQPLINLQEYFGCCI